MAKVVGAANAVWRVSAELAAPYRPGIPILAPGEAVTPAVPNASAEPTLFTLRVLAR